MKKKKNEICSLCPWGPGGGLKALAEMSAKNVCFLLEGSPKHVPYFKFLKT